MSIGALKPSPSHARAQDPLLSTKILGSKNWEISLPPIITCRSSNKMEQKTLNAYLISTNVE
jgi:hypothetical protein